MRAKEFDEKFDSGADISGDIDWSKATRRADPANEPRRVNVDFPSWVVQGLDREAERLGVTRQALIKMWVAEKLG